MNGKPLLVIISECHPNSSETVFGVVMKECQRLDFAEAANKAAHRELKILKRHKVDCLFAEETADDEMIEIYKEFSALLSSNGLPKYKREKFKALMEKYVRCRDARRLRLNDVTDKQIRQPLPQLAELIDAQPLQREPYRGRGFLMAHLAGIRSVIPIDDLDLCIKQSLLYKRIFSAAQVAQPIFHRLEMKKNVSATEKRTLDDTITDLDLMKREYDSVRRLREAHMVKIIGAEIKKNRWRNYGAIVGAKHANPLRSGLERFCNVKVYRVGKELAPLFRKGAEDALKSG